MKPADKPISSQPYVRARESSLFNGLLTRSRSPTTDFEQISTSSGSGSRSGSSSGSPPVTSSRFLSDVGNQISTIQSSGKSIPGEEERSDESPPLESDMTGPDIVLEIQTVRRSSFRHSSDGKQTVSSGFQRSRSVRNDSGYASNPVNKESASSGFSRSASYNVNFDLSGSSDSGCEPKYLTEETATARLPKSHSRQYNLETSSTDDSGNEPKLLVKPSKSFAGLPRSRSHNVKVDSSARKDKLTGVLGSRSFSLAGDSSGSVNSGNEAKPLGKTVEAPKEGHAPTIEGSIVKTPGVHPERLFHLCESKPSPSKVPLPQSAASFYAGFSLQLFQIVESCESMKRVNQYLKARKDEVRAGAPGKFLQAVLGQESSDIGTIASTILYAFYLHETLRNDQFCTVPVINMKREDLGSRAEISWLLGSCQVDESSLIFVDEIDLHYYDLFGSLKVVLLNGYELPAKQEALKGAVIEVFNCQKAESMYLGVQRVTVSENDSCCTLIAEKFMQSSLDILAGVAFSRLLLSGILLDTGNLSTAHSSTKDKYISCLLINGAGQYGFNGLYQILRHQKYDVSNLKVIDALRKDFKKWSRSAKSDIIRLKLIASDIGMSSTGMSMKKLLTNEKSSIEAIKYFQELEKLGVLVVVSGYYDSQKKFKREMLIVGETEDVTKSILKFFNANDHDLPITPFYPTELKDEMRAVTIDKIISRQTIERLLVECCGESYSRCY